MSLVFNLSWTGYLIIIPSEPHNIPHLAITLTETCITNHVCVIVTLVTTSLDMEFPSPYIPKEMVEMGKRPRKLSPKL